MGCRQGSRDTLLQGMSLGGDTPTLLRGSVREVETTFQGSVREVETTLEESGSVREVETLP